MLLRSTSRLICATVLLLAGCAATVASAGIPFGTFNLPRQRFGKGFDSAMLSVSPRRVVETLTAAREARMRLVISLPGGSKRHYRKPDGSFDLEPWKRRMDRFAGVDLAPFLADGTILANYLVDEPKCRSCWGGKRIPNPVIDEMARYSQQLFPGLPTAVRAEPSDLEEPGWTWKHLDLAWAQFAARKGPVEAYVAEQVASARSQGLGLVGGLNLIAGGDGSSGHRAPEPWSKHWTLSAGELRRYASAFLDEPYVCALLMWRYFEPEEFSYFERPPIRAALQELSLRAAARPPVSCRPGVDPEAEG